jgi:hypothetical protein
MYPWMIPFPTPHKDLLEDLARATRAMGALLSPKILEANSDFQRSWKGITASNQALARFMKTLNVKR